MSENTIYFQQTILVLLTPFSFQPHQVYFLFFLRLFILKLYCLFTGIVYISSSLYKSCQGVIILLIFLKRKHFFLQVLNDFL